MTEPSKTDEGKKLGEKQTEGTLSEQIRFEANFGIGMPDSTSDAGRRIREYWIPQIENLEASPQAILSELEAVIKADRDVMSRTIPKEDIGMAEVKMDWVLKIIADMKEGGQKEK